MRSRRQTLSQGPFPRKPRSYLSRRKHSVAPHSRGSRRPSLVSEDGLSLHPRVRRFGPDVSLRSRALRDALNGIHRARTCSSSWRCSGSPRCLADPRLLSPTPPMSKEVRMNTS